MLEEVLPVPEIPFMHDVWHEHTEEVEDDGEFLR